MKTVNLANVKFSPKYIVWFILACVVVLLCWTIAKFLFGYATKTIGVAGKITDTAPSSSW